MIEKAEWEVVDAPRFDSNGWTISQTMQALLGKRWRWKLAGIAVLLSLAFVLLTALSFIAFFIALSGGVIVMAVNAFRKKFSNTGKFSSGKNLMS